MHVRAELAKYFTITAKSIKVNRNNVAYERLSKLHGLRVNAQCQKFRMHRELLAKLYGLLFVLVVKQILPRRWSPKHAPGNLSYLFIYFETPWTHL